MTDEELGRAKYEREAQNWPSPVGWENLSEGSKALWIERALKNRKKNDNSNI